MMKFFSSCTALITPYTAKGIDYDKLSMLIERQLESGIECILANGTTAEPHLLTEQEKWQQIRFVIECVDGRVPVLVGSGSISTANTLDNSLRAIDYGADCLLVVTPYYNKTSQEGIVEHFTYIADNICVPLVIYNVPSRTGFDIAVDSIAKLSTHPRIMGIKQATSDIGKTFDLYPYLSDKFRLFCGEEGLLAPMTAIGGSGVISVVSNVVPKLIVEYTRTNDIFLGYTIRKIADAVFCQTNPIPVKYIMHRLGLLDEYYLRMPLIRLNKTYQSQIDDMLPLLRKYL